jgi:hypothetical protein
MSPRPTKVAWQSLTDAERRLIRKHFDMNENRAAKAMGLGAETYRNLMSPGGCVTASTMTRVRTLLATLQEKGEQDGNGE